MYQRFYYQNPFYQNNTSVRQGPAAVILGILGLIGTAATVYSVGSTAFHSYIYHKHKRITDYCASLHPFQWDKIQRCLEENAVPKDDAETIRAWLEWVDQKIRTVQNITYTPSPYGKWKVSLGGNETFNLTFTKRHAYYGDEVYGTYDWNPPGEFHSSLLAGPFPIPNPLRGHWNQSKPTQIKDPTTGKVTETTLGGYFEMAFSFGPGGIPEFVGYQTFSTDRTQTRYPFRGTQIEEFAQ